MPKPDSYGQNVQYPVLSDAPNIETALQALVNGVVPLTVMRFPNANARAATLTGSYKPVPGMITYLIAEDRWERRDGDNVWRPFSPGVWKPITYTTGYTSQSGAPGYRIINNEVQLRGTIRRTAANTDLVTNTDVHFATLPSEARPIGGYRYFLAAANFVNTSGTSYFSGRIGIAPDGSMIYVMPLNSKSEWLSLDGIRFSID